MTDMQGFDVLEALPERGNLHVVFVTAHDHFALLAFEDQALDYILKPVDPDRFDQVLQRVKKQMGRGRPDEFQEKLRALLQRFPSRLLLPGDGRSFFVQVAEIDWLES